MYLASYCDSVSCWFLRDTPVFQLTTGIAALLQPPPQEESINQQAPKPSTSERTPSQYSTGHRSSVLLPKCFSFLLVQLALHGPDPIATLSKAEALRLLSHTLSSVAVHSLGRLLSDHAGHWFISNHTLFQRATYQPGCVHIFY